MFSRAVVLDSAEEETDKTIDKDKESTETEVQPEKGVGMWEMR